MSPSQLAWRAAHYTPWYERIGDGGTGGWLTAAAYLATGAICLLAARRAARDGDAERTLWRAAGAALCLLGANKQLDLQVALIELWRELAIAQGWYGARRVVQAMSFAAGLAIAAGAAAWLIPQVRRSGRAVRWGFAGMIVIGMYVALRAAKFQHVLWDDPELATGPGSLALLEWAGIAIVAGAAAMRLRRAS